MIISNRRKVAFLFAGDLACFALSLYIALFLRGGEYLRSNSSRDYILPFTILIGVWMVDFYIAGLYDKPTLILRSRLPSIIFKTQLVNATIAALFFYLFPLFGIAPKTVLFIDLIVSFIAILFWRMYGAQFMTTNERQTALLLGEGLEVWQLFEEVNGNNRYSIRFAQPLDTSTVPPHEMLAEIIRRVENEDIRIIAMEFGSSTIDPLMAQLYDLFFPKMQFIDSHDIYEDAFDRISLSLVTHGWFLRNVSVSQRLMYDVLKRTMDIVISLCLGVVALLLFPFLYIAIKLDDGWKIFILQDRVGQNDKLIRIIKYRSMSIDDGGAGSVDREKKVTRVGKFMRASRIDELPQLWNVLRGDLSLIGPRPEMPGLVSLYEKEIPFYKVRHLIKPGLSGWAQLCDTMPPKYGADYERTRSKLAYDLYYVKNRSFVLDLHIALKTVKDLLSRKGI